MLTLTKWRIGGKSSFESYPVLNLWPKEIKGYYRPIDPFKDYLKIISPHHSTSEWPGINVFFFFLTDLRNHLFQRKESKTSLSF